jgi:hypothetical protein
MAIVMSRPDFFPRRINMYVEAMQFADAVNSDGPTRITFGAPLTPSTINIDNARALPANANLSVDYTPILNAQVIPAFWGRSIQITTSVANGKVAILRGGDYLGQPLREDLTLGGAAATVQSKKAFKYLDSIFFPSNGAAPGTISVGWGLDLGLPFKTIRAQFEIANGAAVATLGTFTAASLVDPQTPTTTDPRGKYRPVTALNGANVISLIADCVNDVNSSSRGGLHGIRHTFS